MGVEVAIGSAAAISKVAISNGHWTHFYFFTRNSLFMLPSSKGLIVKLSTLVAH